MNELLAFVTIVIGLAICGLWRVRRGGTSWRESPNAGLPHDQRDKRLLHRTFHPIDIGVGVSRPISRESGSGKDGGG